MNEGRHDSPVTCAVTGLFVVRQKDRTAERDSLSGKGLQVARV
ncbi:hypothetical protein [Numidum massiliense]|nr:hypothetical protein [Numidum massiliense]